MTRKLLFILLLTVSSIFAQDPNWNSFITFPTYPSPYLSDWERNPNMATFNINYLGTAPVQFYFKVIITIDGYGEALVGYTATREYSSGPVSEILTFDDISDWESSTINPDLERLVVQSGKLPESSYSICISTYSALNNALLTEACTQFDIALPNPPQLISPEEEGTVNIAFPTFMWNQVSAPSDILVHYHLKIVEKLEGQNAYRAIQSNVPVLNVDIPYNNLYTYQPEDYPLEKNHTYAWQVQATNEDGVPVATNEGRSEIWEFTYGGARGNIGVDTLVLVPNVAKLIDLNNLAAVDNETSLMLDGSCALLLTLPDNTEKRIDVSVQSLSVQKGDYSNPVYLSGTVSGDLYSNDLPKSLTGNLFQPRRLQFIVPNQFTLEGNFVLGTDTDVPLNGQLTYDGSQLSGTLTGNGSEEEPLFQMGDSDFNAKITSLSATFPLADFSLGGIITVFNSSSGCNLTNISLNNNGDFSASVSCSPNKNIPLIQGSNLLNLNLGSLTGTFSGNLLNTSLSYDITANGGLIFNPSEGNSFGASVTLRLRPNDFQLVSFNPDINMSFANIDLGWLKWKLSDLKVNKLTFTNGSWDFEIATDMKFTFPQFSSQELPTIPDIKFTPSGFSFPQLDLTNFTIPDIDFSAFKIALEGFHMTPFTFDWANWSPETIANMSFGWDIKFNMPNLPEGTPEALKNLNLTLHPTISAGNFNVQIPKIDFSSPLTMPLVSGINFDVSSIEGMLKTTYSNSLMSYLPDLKFEGDISLPSTFSCDNGTPKIHVKIAADGNGRMNGTIENLVPECPLVLGPVKLQVKSSKIEFKYDTDQKISIDGSAGISFDDNEVGTLEMGYEILHNNLYKLDGDITNPFHYKIPSASPVLDFMITSATVQDKILSVDGLQKFNLDNNTQVSVTFDNFKIGLLDFTLHSGRVIFGTPFNLKIGGLSSNLTFQTLPSGTTLTDSSGVMISLPNSIELNQNGLKIDGNGTAEIRYNGKNVASIGANFINNFGFGLSPFAVNSGQCDFMYNNQRVAYVNNSGFFPDPNFFLNAVLPDKIPLPLEDVAYIKIKEAGQLLVNISEQNGIYQISTKPGQPVDLVFPGLQFSNPTDPKILVNFSIKFNPNTRQVTDGSILAVPPETGNSPFDLSQYGIPVKIDTMFYGNINGTYGFRLHSLLKLFDTEFSSENAINLYIGSDGKLKSTLDMNMQQTIAMIQGSDKLNLKLKKLTGSFDVNLLTSDIQFNLSLDSEIKIKVDNGKEVGASATIVASKTGINVQNYTMDVSQLGEIGMDFFKMAIKKVQMPKLEFHNANDPNPGWDFEFNLDFDLDFPSLGFKIPGINGVQLTKSGLHIPEISLPSFNDSLKFQFQGFEFKPLAFRTPAIDIDWFSSSPVSIDWSQMQFDFAINFPNVANDGGLMATPDLTIRNASFTNGILNGSLEKTFNQGDLKLNFGGAFALSVTKISGALFDNSGSQGVRFGLRGVLDLPDFMRCSTTTTADVSTVEFNFDSRGLIDGTVTNFVPTCPIDLGFGTFTVNNSSIIFSIKDNAQSAILDMDGVLNVPTGQGQNVTANGAVKLNLITGELVDGQISINGPFAWSIPYDNPVFKFTINSAVLNKDGLMINGSSQLALEGGATQTVQFNNFLFDYMNLKVKGGNITIAGNIGLKLSLPTSGGINWAIIGNSDSLTTDRSAMIGFGGSVIIDTNGVHTSGTANAAVRWDAAHTFNGMNAAFSNDFSLKIKPFEVATGRVDLKLNDETIAYLDNGGFHLGNVFGIIPLPEKIPLPDTTIAYVKIKNGDTVLLETNQSGSDLQLKTKSGQPVKLFIPALKNGSTVPSFDVAFDITVNTSTWQLVSGGISVAGSGDQPLIDLQALIGIPIKIEKVSYNNDGGSYKLAADAKISLPEAMGGLPIDLSDLSFNEHGLSGSVSVGQYSMTTLTNPTTIAKTNLGSDVVVSLEGATAQFGDNKEFKFSGSIIPLMLVNGTDTTKIHYAAEWNSSQNEFVFGFDFTEGQKFDFGVAEFYPRAINPDPAMKLTFSGSNFEFSMGGTLKVPSFDPNFAIAFKGFKINNSGVSVDAVHINDVNQALTFNLFNSQFRIYDSFPNSEAISFAYNNKVLSLTLSGDLDVLGKVVKFKGFKVATDGTISIQSLNLLDSKLVIVQNYLSLDTLSINNVDNKYRLALAGDMKLPESISETSSFHFGFEIGTDGHVYSNSTDNKIVFLNETQGLGGNDNSEYTFWKATIDPTYFDLGLNFGDMSQSYVRFLGDIYWNEDANQRVEFGKRNADGTINQAAFKITFGGNVTWGDVTINQTVSFDWEMLNMHISSLSIHPTQDNIFITLGGGFGLNISSVSGSIEIEGLKISKNGVDDFGMIKSAQLKIASIVDIQLDSLVYKSQPSTITVKSGSMPGAGDQGSNPSSSTQTIQVKNYFSFSGHITIANVLSGGVHKFMTYTTMNDEFNLLIENAFIKYSNVFELHMDLVYKTQGSDYFLLAGAEGKIMSYNITVVGQAGNFGGVDRFGFFIAVDVNIPIGPVVVAGVGGGFFYHPTGETINTIKRLAKLDDTGGTNDKIKPPDDGTKFAIFLFGKFTLVNDKIIMGRVLLTLTDTQFYLDGKVIMLDQKNSIYGTIHLAVNFQAGEFEGNIKVKVNMVSVIKGNGEISAYIYDENTWAVMGKTDVKVLKLIDVKSEFFVGPSGFLVSFTATKSFDIWIIELEGGFDAKVWYIQNVSWGLYAKVWIKVEVCGGAAGAEGWLKGALFGSQGDFFMYGVAGLKVHLLFIKWHGSVWGKIKNGHTSGGFGADSDMEKMIEDAGKTADQAEQAKNDMQNEINSHPVPTRQFSEEELASAFDMLSKWGKLIKYGNPAEKIVAILALGSLQIIEKQGLHYDYDSHITSSERNVENYAIQTYIGTDAPDLEEMKRQSEFIDSLLTQFTVARANLLNKLNKNMEKIETISSNIQEAGENPVTSMNLTQVQRDANGNVINQPGFNFDESINNENKNNLENAQREIAQYEHKIFEKIAKIDSNIVTIEQMIFGQTSTYQGGSAGGSNSTSSASGYVNVGVAGYYNGASLVSPSAGKIQYLVPIDKGAEGFSEGYASYFHSIDAAFVSQYAYYKNLQSWASNRASFFVNSSTVNAFRNAMTNKANYIYQQDWRGLKNLTAQRVYFLTLLATNDANQANQEKQTIKNQFDSEKSSKSESIFKNWAVNTNVQYGINLWIDVPRVGLKGVKDTSGQRSKDVRLAKLSMLSNLAGLQASLTQKMNGLYTQLAKFVELKYDLYDRLIERRDGVTENIDSTVSTSYLQSQKVLLGNRMKLPVIASLNYTTFDRGYYSDVQLDWNVTGTGGEYAKAMIDFNSSNPYFPSQGKQSVGGVNKFRLLYIPNTISTSSGGIFGATQFSLYIKNGLGYTVRRNVSFIPKCSGQVNGTYSSSSGSGSLDSTPPAVYRILTCPYHYNGEFTGYVSFPRIHYTSDTATVSASWSAWDNESGIREYRYKFVSANSPFSSGNNNSSGNNSGVGSVGNLFDNGNVGVVGPVGNAGYLGGGNNLPFNDWINNHGRDNVEIHGLQLLHKHFYQLYVVAQNGDNVWSTDTIGTQQYLMVDTTPPDAPQPKNGSVYIRSGEQSNSFNYRGSKQALNQGDYIDGGHRYPGDDNTNATGGNSGYSQVFTTGFMNVTYSVNPPIDLPANIESSTGISLNSSNTRTGKTFQVIPSYDNSNISELFAWNKGSDQESGIYSYEYRVTKKGDPSKVTPWIDNGNSLSVTLRNSTTGIDNIMTYIDTFYLDVRSVNKANKRSEQMLRFTFLPIDKTVPTKPDVNMAYAQNHSRVYLIFNHYSNDPETGIDHYEVAVGSSPDGSFNYVSWSDSIFIDPAYIGSDNAYLLPVLPNNSVSYIAVRAVNGQGKAGAVCYTGPYYNDSTPPATPSVSTTTYNISGQLILAMSFSGLSDPESNIIGVDYKIEKITYTNNSAGSTASTSGNTTSSGSTSRVVGSVVTYNTGNFSGFGNGGTVVYGGSNGMTYVPNYTTVVDWTSGSSTSIYKRVDNLGIRRGDALRISVRSKNGAYLYSQVYTTNYTIP